MRHSSSLTFLTAGLLLLSGCGTQKLDIERGPETAPEGLTALSPAALAGECRHVDFQTMVRPVLENKCLPCHSAPAASGRFRLDTREAAFARGPGGPRIVPGHPEASIMLAFASTHKNMAVMPVVGNRLTSTESRILRRWILEGARWPLGTAGHLKPASDTLSPEASLLRQR